MLKNQILRCDMKRDCAAPVSMLDNKGFVYCADHGLQRREGGIPCRKLRPSEIKQLERGQAIRSY